MKKQIPKFHTKVPIKRLEELARMLKQGEVNVVPFGVMRSTQNPTPRVKSMTERIMFRKSEQLKRVLKDL
jgi:hypothetical protein